MKWKINLPWNKSSEQPEPLYYDLRMTQIGDYWFWEIYHERDRIAFGKEQSVRKAFRSAVDRAKPHKIITAHLDKE